MTIAALPVRLLPKADLRSHIDGSLTPRELFAIAIATRHGRRITTPLVSCSGPRRVGSSREGGRVRGAARRKFQSPPSTGLVVMLRLSNLATYDPCRRQVPLMGIQRGNTVLDGEF